MAMSTQESYKNIQQFSCNHFVTNKWAWPCYTPLHIQHIFSGGSSPPQTTKFSCTLHFLQVTLARHEHFIQFVLYT